MYLIQRTTYKYFLSFVLLFLSANCTYASESVLENYKIITTIKPLQLIIKAVLGENQNVQLLIPAGTSPHHYQLKPSQLKLISSSDMLIWVGPDLEQFLIPLIKHSNINNIPLFNPQNTHNNDPHIWLDPNTAIKIARKIGDAIIRENPKSQAEIEENISAFTLQVQATIKYIEQLLHTKNNKPSIVTFHNAYAYFTQYFNIPIKEVVTLSPDRLPGTKHLALLHLMLKKTQSCLLIEPEVTPPFIKTLTANTPTLIKKIDPLASKVSVSIHGYTNFLKDITHSFLDCYKE